MMAVGFDAQRIPLPSAYVERMLDLPNSSGVRDQFRLQDLIATARYELNHGAGFVIFSGFDGIDEARAASVALSVSSWFGVPVPQDAAGRVVRRVEDRGARIGEGRSRYADSRFGGSLHTDGAEAPMPVPDYFALLCVRQAPTGGALQIAHLRDLVPLLEDDGAAPVLRRPFHFDRRGDAAPGEAPTVVKPILFPDGDREGVTYLREYVERGHDHPGVPGLTADQRRALDALDRRLADPAILTEGRLRPGEMGVFANRQVLHGRTTFEDDQASGARLLVRTWLRAGSATS